MTSQNDTTMTISRKMKIGKIWNLFSFIQPIVVLSCKFDHFWEFFYLLFWCWIVCMQDQNPKKNIFFQRWSNIHEKTAIGCIKIKTKFYFSSYAEKHCSRKFFECRWMLTCSDKSPKFKSMQSPGAKPNILLFIL